MRERGYFEVRAELVTDSRSASVTACWQASAVGRDSPAVPEGKLPDEHGWNIQQFEFHPSHRCHAACLLDASSVPAAQACVAIVRSYKVISTFACRGEVVLNVNFTQFHTYPCTTGYQQDCADLRGNYSGENQYWKRCQIYCLTQPFILLPNKNAMLSSLYPFYQQQNSQTLLVAWFPSQCEVNLLKDSWKRKKRNAN